MAIIDPNQLGPGELYLSGRLQVDAAIDVLEVTEANAVALESLRNIKRAHDLLSPTGEAMDDLRVYLSGGNTEAMKSAIISSALLAEENQTLSEEKRTAASALLEVLGVKK